LMETEVKLEYGNKLKNSRVVHQEMLYCYSTKAPDLFKKAKPLREAYATANAMRKRFKAHVPPRVSVEDFEIGHMENQIIPQIVTIYEKNHLSQHRKSLQAFVDAAIADFVQRGGSHVVAKSNAHSIHKKDLNATGLQERLNGLTSRSVFSLARRLFNKLRDIKDKETKAAETNAVKAAAQGRIILATYEDRVIRSFQCLSRIAGDTDHTMQVALAQGLSLQHLLGLAAHESAQGEEEPLAVINNVVQVVFQHVLKDEKSPPRLLDLVVDTLAEHLDLELWTQLEHVISHNMSLRLNRAMVDRRQIKIEDAERVSMESKSLSAGDHFVPCAPNEHIHA
ncbi:hypothetical protein EK21DRAFT_66106, partial [Setomelanomma holmii]